MSRSHYNIREVSDSHNSHRELHSSRHSSRDSHNKNENSEIIRKLSKLTDALNKIDKRLTKLEASGKDYDNIKADVDAIKNQIVVNDYAINADSHLNQYLMEVKEQEAIEMAVTSRDIEKGTKKINARRTNRR